MSTTHATGTLFRLNSTNLFNVSIEIVCPTGSSITRILPPQANPTEKASSLLTPYSSSLIFFVLIVSSASDTTAFSIHPPDTEPCIFPFKPIAICAPTRRGAEPQVSTTVAKTTGSPRDTQDRAISGMLSLE